MLPEREMGILWKTQKSMDHETNVWSTTQNEECSIYMIQMLGLNETIDQLAIANSVRWYGHVMRKEDVHVLRKALDF